MKIDILINNVKYDPATGSLFNKNTNRQLNPDADGFVYYSHSKPTKVQIKIKANRLCCLLGFGKEVQKSQRVLHKNLNENDYRLINLAVVTDKELIKINEARVNLESRLKLVAHPEDQLSYFLYWRENGVEKRQLILDIVVARRRLLKLQLKYSKILSRYCIFED